MPLWRRKPYDRTETLAAADRARAQRRVKKAIAGYRKVLEQDPGDLAVHGKIAPLLAERGERGEAMASFQLAAEGHLRAGFADRALSVYVQAVGFFPDAPPLWDEIARLHLVRGRRADAVNALVGGASRLGSRSRDGGIGLIRKALELEPYHLDATLALARLLSAAGRRALARDALEDLAGRVRGKALRRVRGALFRLAPTPASAWRWLRAAL